MERGLFIVLEGIDGSGKTTHIKKLEQFFNEKGLPCICTREPGGTDLGRRIRAILLNNEGISIPPLSELFLYEADRVKQYATIVDPNLERGINVLSDRSWPATDVYQGTAGKIDINLIRQLNKIATFGINPDLLFIIDGDPKELLKKEINPDRFARKGLEYHQRVREGYLEIAKQDPEKYFIIPYIKGGEDKMQEEMRYHVKERFGI